MSPLRVPKMGEYFWWKIQTDSLLVHGILVDSILLLVPFIFFISYSRSGTLNTNPIPNRMRRRNSINPRGCGTSLPSANSFLLLPKFLVGWKQCSFLRPLLTSLFFWKGWGGEEWRVGLGLHSFFPTCSIERILIHDCLTSSWRPLLSWISPFFSLWAL